MTARAHPRFGFSLAALITVLALPGAACADVIFNDLPPGGAYTQDGYTVEGADAPEYGFYHEQGQVVSPGMQITVGPSDYALTSLQIGLTWENQSYLTGGATAPGTNAATISLFAADGTSGSPAEGALLGQWNLTDLPQGGPMADSVTPVTRIDGITGITLQAGTNYIVEVEPGASDAYMVWCDDGYDANPDINATVGPILENGVYIGDDYQPALELDGAAISSGSGSGPSDPGGGTDVPEPSTLALLAIGILAVACHRTGASLAMAIRRSLQCRPAVPLCRA